MMLAERTLSALVSLIAPIAWRTDRRAAKKLAEFSATEAGSALDMLRAAELAEDPRVRRLFLRHALDEARHARIFRTLARTLDPSIELSEYARAHALQQDLYANLGLPAFLAFVHLAERRGEAHFLALCRYFEERRPELRETFASIAKDERFHVRYTARLLEELGAAGLASPKKALATERLRSAWAVWRRAGRRLGDAAARLMLATLYVVVLPPFALIQKRLDPERTGWKKSQQSKHTLKSARRQF